MTATLAVEDWLPVLDAEYLSTFIKDGGAAVKFAVTPEARKPALHEALKARCEALGYLFVALDAVTSRVHMPQDIFFGLASRIDWRLLARRLILRLLSEKGYRTDGVDPTGEGDVIAAAAEANGRDSPFVRTGLALRKAIQDQVFKDLNMARAFRVAMTQLCLWEAESSVPEHYVGQPLLDWLTGKDTRIGPVRPFAIHTGINRTTARHFIESAFHWVRVAGYAGTVVVLDNARATVARNPKDSQRYYTRAMTMDHYELLREFIDDVDRLSGTLLTVMTSDAFIDDHAPRGWHIYDALRTRVMDDVRDRDHANPVAALVRLS